MNNGSFVDITCSWGDGINNEVSKCIVYNNEDPDATEELNFKPLESVTLHAASDDETTREHASHTVCELSLTCNTTLHQQAEISAIDVLCNARTMEVYTPLDGYLATADGITLTDLTTKEHSAFLLQHTFDDYCKKCTLKLLNMQNQGSIWIHSIHITLAFKQPCSQPGSLLSSMGNTAPDIDFNKVKAMMKEMNNGIAGDAQGLLTSMQATQANRKAQEASMERAFGAMMCSMVNGATPGGQAGAALPGMMAAMSSMNSAPTTEKQHSDPPPTTHHNTHAACDSTESTGSAATVSTSSDVNTKAQNVESMKDLPDLSAFMNVFSSLGSGAKDGKRQQAPTMADLMAMATASGINVAPSSSIPSDLEIHGKDMKQTEVTDISVKQQLPQNGTSYCNDTSISKDTSASNSTSTRASNDASTGFSATNDTSVINGTSTKNVESQLCGSVAASDEASGDNEVVTHKELSQLEGKLFNSIHEMETRLSEWMQESERRMHARLDAVLAQLTDSEESM